MGKNEKMQWDIIVIGAGASGMMSAITAARNGKQVLILEKLDKAGKKLLATGNGKCNFTNKTMSFNCFHGEKHFVSEVLEAFSVDDALEFFHSIGIYPKEKNGYYYPNSEQASSVLNALLDEINRLNVSIAYGIKITNIFSDKHNVSIQTNNGDFFCKKLIIATGLKAAPKLGSDGSMFDIIKGLGHRFVPVLPALCGFYCKGIDFKRVSGVRAQGTVVAFVDEKEVARDTGEIQFTEYGLSGIPVFQISRHLSRGIYNKSRVVIGVNLLPDFDREKLISELNFRKEQFGTINIEKLLNGLVNQKLSDMIQHELGKNTSIDKIADFLLFFKVNVTNYRDYEFAQVCTGGIPIKDLNEKTLESKFASNIHFAGEIIDVDGICGGYNLQFAWATGFIAGNAVSK